MHGTHRKKNGDRKMLRKNNKGIGGEGIGKLTDKICDPTKYYV